MYQLDNEHAWDGIDAGGFDPGQYLETKGRDKLAFFTEYEYFTDLNVLKSSAGIYPTAMRVWLVKFENGVWKATYLPEFDNILKYAGSSIRITGKKGIRMITAVPRAVRGKLTGKEGLKGLKLVEYGTVLKWGGPAVQVLLDEAGAKHAYAYKRGAADPIFSSSNAEIKYTNVLVGITDDKVKSDLWLRPYMILEYTDGSQLPLYGAILKRSIGYIAYQNRAAFGPRTAAYTFIWDIIHAAYGTTYDAEYKK